MSSTATKPHPLSNAEARRLWLHAQRLGTAEPFGGGPEATRRAIEPLGYVQIDTINVIERCHHHILYTRIPGYERAHLHQAQSVDKSVFEYWTHALSYVPTSDLRFYRRAMRDYRKQPRWWFGSVSSKDLRKVLSRVRNLGPLSIRDIDDDVLVEKDHEWASRKPSKRALQLAFYTGVLTVSARLGMLKTYELMERHFAWETPPRPASESEILGYLLDRSLRAQGIVSLDSICYMDAPRKSAMRKLIGRLVRRGELVPAALEGAGKTEHWATPEALAVPERTQETVTCSRPSIRWSSSASGCSSSSTTSTVSRPTCPRKSASSAISPCRCWSTMPSSPCSTSRPTGRRASSSSSNGPGSHPVVPASRTSGASRRRSAVSSASSSQVRRPITV